MRFYLGSHHATQRWFDLGVPLFVSRRVLAERRKLPVPQTGWALDSGGFTELSLYGEWRTPALTYISDIDRFADSMPHLEWVAPQDWMCEPFMLAKTGLTVEEHQRRTILNFEQLRYHLGDLVIPVLQGWERDDYLRHWEMYERWYFPLEHEPLVGLGSVCRRQDTAEAGRIVRSLAPLKLHYFGAKLTGLESFGDALASADSMAWSVDARWRAARGEAGLRGCTHKSCANCPRYAMRWRQQLLDGLAQQRFEVAV